MSGASFLRQKGLNAGAGHILVAARHNLRELQNQGGATANIDPTRSCLNLVLDGPETAAGVAALADALMAEAGAVARRKDTIRAVEFVFSLPAGSAIGPVAYFGDCLAWLRRHVPCPVISAVVHLDEAAPHAHVLVVPLVDGRLQGAKVMGNREHIQRMQADFTTEVAGPHGLKSVKRLAGRGKVDAAKAVIDHLRRGDDPVLRSALWSEVRERIERDPGQFVQALGIDLEDQPKRMRTMAEIFTSKGKGGNRERSGTVRKRLTPIEVGCCKVPMPIEVDTSNDAGKAQPLSCVEVGISEPAKPEPQAHDNRVDAFSEVELSAVAKKARKKLRTIPVGQDDKLVIRSAHACGVSVDELAQWAGDRARVLAVLSTGEPVGWRVLFEVG